MARVYINKDNPCECGCTDSEAGKGTWLDRHYWHGSVLKSYDGMPDAIPVKCANRSEGRTVQYPETPLRTYSSYIHLVRAARQARAKW